MRSERCQRATRRRVKEKSHKGTERRPVESQDTQSIWGGRGDKTILKENYICSPCWHHMCEKRYKTLTWPVKKHQSEKEMN